MLAVTVPYILGIILYRYAGWWPELALAFILVAALAWRFESSVRLVAVVVAAMSLGLTVAWLDRPVTAIDAPAGHVELTGTVKKVYERELSTSAIVATGDGNCWLLAGDAPELYPGDVIEFSADITPVDPFCDTLTTRQSTFYLVNRISFDAKAEWGQLHVVGRDDNWRYKLWNVRQRLVDKIVCSHLSPQAQEMACAIVVGEGSIIPPTRREQYGMAGVSHMLALSGMHVAIIAWLLSFVLWPVRSLTTARLPLGTGRWIHAVIVSVALVGYAFLTGLSPSVVRAVIMAVCYLLARAAGRGRSTLNSLCVAAMVLLLVNPMELFAAGFQLSFAAMLAIITVPQVLPSIQSRSIVKRTILNYLMFSLAAILGTMLLAVYYFGRFPWIVAVANIPVALLLPVILVGAIIVLVCQLMGFPSYIVASVVNGSVSVLDECIGLIGRVFPAPTVTMPWWGVWCGYIAIALGLIAYKKRRLVYVWPSLVLAILTVWSTAA